MGKQDTVKRKDNENTVLEDAEELRQRANIFQELKIKVIEKYC